MADNTSATAADFQSLKAGDLTSTAIGDIASLAKGEYTRARIQDCAKASEDPDVELLFHNGNVTLAQLDDLFSKANYRVIVVIEGDLTVSGLFCDSYTEPETIVVVTGNLHATDIITAGFLEVQGNLVATNCLLGDYNDCSAEIFGNLQAHFVFPENHHFSVHGELIADIALGITPANASAVVLASDEQQRAVLVDAVLVIEGDDDEWWIDDINFAEMKQRVSSGTSIFKPRKTAPPKTAADAVRLSLQNKIAAAEKVTTLSLNYKGLTAFPDVCFEFHNLKKLSLDDNLISELPDAIAQLSQLTSLSLDNNPMTDLSPAIGKLTQLKMLSLRYVKLRHLPNDIGDLTNLTELWLTFSALEGFPQALHRLKKLKKLWLMHCYDITEDNLAATLQELESMHQLTHLGFIQGNLQHLPERIRNLGKLKQLNLADNRFSPDEQKRIVAWLPETRVTFNY